MSKTRSGLPVRSRWLVLVAPLVVVLGACANNMIVPSPDGIVWIRECHVAVVEDGVISELPDPGVCPVTVEVAPDGVLWVADPDAQLRRWDGLEWTRIQPPGDLRGDGDPGSVLALDLAVASDGSLWMVTGYGPYPDRLSPLLHRYSEETWTTFRDASGTPFGFVREWYEPSNRLLVSFDEGAMAFATHGGLFLFNGHEWHRITAGDFSTASVAPDGTLWIGGSSGVFTIPQEMLPISGE